MKKYEKPYLQSNEISLDDIILLSQSSEVNIIGGVKADDIFGDNQIWKK